MDTNITGERIKEMRTEKDISQAALAEILGVARMTIVNYENGKNIPETDFLLKSSEYFDCSVDYILGISDVKNKAHLQKLSFLSDAINDKFSKLHDSFKDAPLNYANALFEELITFVQGAKGSNIWTALLELTERIWFIVNASNSFIDEQTKMKNGIFAEENSNFQQSDAQWRKNEMFNGVNRVLIASHNASVVFQSLIDLLQLAIVDSAADDEIKQQVIEIIYNSTGKRFYPDNIAELFWETYGKGEK